MDLRTLRPERRWCWRFALRIHSEKNSETMPYAAYLLPPSGPVETILPIPFTPGLMEVALYAKKAPKS